MTKRDDVMEGSKAATAKYGAVYSCRCGWIDIGHGTASSTRPFVGADKLWATINTESGTPSTNGLWHFVRYRQDWIKKAFGVTISEGDVTRDYAVRLGLSQAQKEQVALSIFMEVSIGFEDLQGKGLPGVFSNSSFSGEDLVSDLIGFYRVVRPSIDYITLCQPVSKKAALAVWDKYGAPGSSQNKNFSFGPLLYPCSDCKGGPGGPVSQMLPPELMLIQPVPIGELYRKWDPLDPILIKKPAEEPKPPAGPDTPKPPAEKTHLVVRGDTLSGLAATMYGDWRLWQLLWTTNRGVVGTNPNRLKRGVVLRVPALESFTAAQRAEARRLAPQWKMFPM